MLQALLAIEYLNNTTLAGGVARVFNDPPVLSVREAQNQIISLKGQVAIFNELKTYQEQLNQYYNILNTQQNITPATNNSPIISDEDDNQGQIPNNLPFANPNPIPNPNVNVRANRGFSRRGTLRRTLGDIRRRLTGHGGRLTKKRRRPTRRVKRHTKRKNNRRYSRKK
jgi:hypothetical protein